MAFQADEGVFVAVVAFQAPCELDLFRGGSLHAPPWVPRLGTGLELGPGARCPKGHHATYLRICK